jgi:hypothetical protein
MTSHNPNPMIKPLSIIVIFSVLLFLGHYFIIENFFDNEFFYKTWQIYAFLTTATIGIFLIMQFIQKNFPDKTGFAFMALSLFKMAASVIFFIPLMQSQVADRVPDVLNFFIPYFLYLLLEVVFAVRLINSK